MPQMKLKDFAAAKGWTKQNLQSKIVRGTITARALVKDEGGKNVAIISELADEDLRQNGKPFKAALYRGAGKQDAPVVPQAIGDELTDEDDWLEKEIQADVLASTKPKEIPKPKQETREINGQPTPVTVVPPASHDPYDRFRDAKTSKEEFTARKLELELAEIEGRLLDTEGVRKRIVKLVTETKDHLTNLPGKLAPLLVGITDVVEMETTLMKEINRACDALHKLGQTNWTDDDEPED